MCTRFRLCLKVLLALNVVCTSCKKDTLDRSTCVLASSVAAKSRNYLGYMVYYKCQITEQIQIEAQKEKRDTTIDLTGKSLDLTHLVVHSADLVHENI